MISKTEIITLRGILENQEIVDADFCLLFNY